MRFASAPSGWPALALFVLLLAGAGALAFLEYRRPLSPLTPRRRLTLVAIRAFALAVLAAFLFRPTVTAPAPIGHDAVVPIVVDVSRSMRLPGEGSASRIAQAAALLKTQLIPALSRHFQVELYSAGDQLTPVTIDGIKPDASRSDVSGALKALNDKDRNRQVAGIVVLSDGDDTVSTASDSATGRDSGPPIFAVGIGSTDVLHDREVAGLTAGEQHLDESSVDLHVTLLSSGFGRMPFELRVLANGRSIETRRIVPVGDGLPIEETVTVAPDPAAPTAYRVEIPADAGDVAPENNARTVLVSPIGRKRRLLVIQGAPAFEHSFMTRAWSRDPGLEVDSVVREGRNADGRDTFLVQAGAGRGAALSGGFPSRREDLLAYDALVIANVQAEFFTRAQLSMAADFVSERGGGLLVLGGRSFADRGLAGTPLEEALPVQLSDRRGGSGRLLAEDQIPAHNRIRVTDEGEHHPIMRLGSSGDDVRRVWSSMPALSGSAPLGAPRPGASVLAVTSAPTGAVYPVIAVQPYGRGRSMVFGGEASWRWRMTLPSSDRTYEFFWRQAARWLTTAAPDPVAIQTPQDSDPGQTATIEVDARDSAFLPVADATVEVIVTAPDGSGEPLIVHADGNAPGRFAGSLRPERPGVYRIHADARTGSRLLGGADAWMNVGGADREFADPRLNEAWLRRLASNSGGRYVRPNEASRIEEWLQKTAPATTPPVPRDLWHEPWAFALIIALLCGEWILRRRWGLR
jgi:uncharacterized membrane protein